MQHSDIKVCPKCKHMMTRNIFGIYVCTNFMCQNLIEEPSMADSFQSESLNKLEQAMHPGVPVEPEVLVPRDPHVPGTPYGRRHVPKSTVEPKEDPYLPKMRKRVDIEPRNVPRSSGMQERVEIEPPERIVNVCRTEVDELIFREFIRFSSVMREHLDEDLSITRGPMTISIHIRK